MKRPTILFCLLAVIAVAIAVSVSAEESWYYEFPNHGEWYAQSNSQNASCLCEYTPEGLLHAWCLDKEKHPDREDIWIRLKAVNLSASWRSLLPDHVLGSKDRECVMDLIASLGAIMVWVQVVDPKDPDQLLPLEGSSGGGTWSLSKWSEGVIPIEHLAFLILPPDTKEVEGIFELRVLAIEDDSPFKNAAGFSHTGPISFRCWRE